LFSHSAITGVIILYARWNKESSYEAPGSGFAASGVEVLVNDKAEQDGKASVNEEGGKTVITITVDEKKLRQRLERENNDAVVTINVTTRADEYVTQLSGQMVKAMENKGAALEIKNRRRAYILPCAEVYIDAVSGRSEKARAERYKGTDPDLQICRRKVRIA
jgi:hypothetical protein